MDRSYPPDAVYSGAISLHRPAAGQATAAGAGARQERATARDCGYRWRKARAWRALEPASGADFYVAELSLVRTDGSAGGARDKDRKSTRLNSSHTVISYAVFCLKKKKKTEQENKKIKNNI